MVRKLESNKQNIVVTGGAGFIGTNLITRLVKDGHNVVSLDNYSTGTKANHILVPDNCHYVDCDISEGVSDLYGYHPKFNAMENPDLIFHLAALPRIQPSFDYPNETFDIRECSEYLEMSNGPLILLIIIITSLVITIKKFGKSMCVSK